MTSQKTAPTSTTPATPSSPTPSSAPHSKTHPRIRTPNSSPSSPTKTPSSSAATAHSIPSTTPAVATNPTATSTSSPPCATSTSWSPSANAPPTPAPRATLANAKVDDSTLPPLGPVIESRGANEWLDPAGELAAFNIDPRVDVNLFASEEEFPEIACPVQIRWDAKGRLWVACSTTYPHVYPGEKPNDKIVILEDTDGDGKADKSSVFADGAPHPRSVFRARRRRRLRLRSNPTFRLPQGHRRRRQSRLSAAMSSPASAPKTPTTPSTISSGPPDGDLLFRESIFHQLPGRNPLRPRPRSRTVRLVPLHHPKTRTAPFLRSPTPAPTPGASPSTRLGATTSPVPPDLRLRLPRHSIPPYPEAAPSALYGTPRLLRRLPATTSSTSPTWPEEFQGGFVKARYKPTNRIESPRLGLSRPTTSATRKTTSGRPSSSPPDLRPSSPPTSASGPDGGSLRLRLVQPE